MFGKVNVFGTLHGFTVRTKDKRQQDDNKLIEMKFEVPLDHVLADDVLPALVGDLWIKKAGEFHPKPEVGKLVLAIKPEIQILTLKSHPDLDAEFRVSGVSLRQIAVKRGDANTFVLSFTAMWVYGGTAQVEAAIKCLKQGVFLTFEQQEPNLAGMEAPPPAGDSDGGKEATVDGTGNVTNIKDGKKKKPKKRQTPEQIRTEQAAGNGPDQAGQGAEPGGEPPADEPGGEDGTEQTG